MRNWNIQSEDPITLIIAADVRCGPTNYYNDHIWELKLVGGEPSALAIQTTLGFRARNFRIFPRFIEGDTVRVDPSTFEKPPTVYQFFPNYLAVKFSPFTGIDVVNEYWVPDSNLLAGRVQVSNSRLEQRKIRFQLVALLYPSDEGHRMAPQDIELSTTLCGQTGKIYPVIFMTGGPESTLGPYPALSIILELAPGSSRQYIWAHSALEDIQSSFQKIRQFTIVPWIPEISKLQVLNQRLIEIETGNPDWDIAFSFGLKQAYNLFVGPTENLPSPSFVINRVPEQGYSRLGDGTDFNHLWDGQLPLESYYLSSLLLPSSPDLAKGLLLNFLDTQTQSGFIDLKPGLSGKRWRINATPILSQLVWKLFQVTEDQTYLREIFPKLLSFVQSWFTELQDRDRDGLPEWSHPLQSGFEDHPTFSQWQPWSQGGDISKVESPSLCAFLYNEIRILIKIARILEETGPIAALVAIADNLRSAVDASWNSTLSTHLNWDRESHFSPQGILLSSWEGPGEIRIDHKFDTPVRLSISVTDFDEMPHKIKIFIHGVGLSGNYRVERIEWEQIQWHLNRGNVSSDQVYTSLEHIEIIGVNSEDKITIVVMDLSILDHTLFLPLWAEMLDQKQVSKLVHATICNEDKFWKPFGVPACIQKTSQDEYPFNAVHMIWNNFIGEGLLRYGYRREAASLVTKLMNAVIKNLKTDNSFYNFYNAETGRGFGDPNSLGGLPPLSLFLKTLGVHIVSPTKVYIEGVNPYPWPITLRYQNLTVHRDIKKTKIVFPGGQSAIIKNPERREITLENIARDN